MKYRLWLTALVSAGWLTTLFGCGSQARPLAPIPPALSVAQSQPLYLRTCADCHGVQGQGNPRLDAPALWGTRNILSGTLLAQPAALADFIRTYMPPLPVGGVSPGTLTAAQSQGLAHLILQRALPAHRTASTRPRKVGTLPDEPHPSSPSRCRESAPHSSTAR
jgi:cytochrome c